jgi:putative oxidoreductase
MATLTQNRNYLTIAVPKTKAATLLFPLGRLFFSLIFIMSGIQHFSGDSIAYAASQGVPIASVLVPISGVLAIIGGVCVFLGYHARFGSLLLLLFLLPVTFMMHDFWNLTNAQEAQNQMAHFMKNISMIGGALLISVFGAGPLSIDNKKSR